MPGQNRSMRAAAAVLLVLLTAGCGSRHGPSFVVGAVEDAPRWDPGAVALAKAAGFGADVLSARWTRGASADAEAAGLRPAVAALAKAGIDPVLAVYQLSGNTP